MPHTPGPWRADWPENDPCNAQVWSGPNSRICFLAHDDTRQNATGIANARLIAAAPDLYDALASLIEPTPTKAQAQLWTAKLAFAKAALAKARGDKSE